MEIVYGLILIAIGIFTILGAVLQWSFFIEHRKAQFFKKIFGETGMRIFYVVLGGFMLVAGSLVALGVWER